MAVSALVIDDGELKDVRDMLAELEVEYCWIRPAASNGLRPEIPSRLFVTTARHALRLGEMDGSSERRPVRMVVLEDEARAAAAQLRQRGFDYLVRRPVHPIALQLLMLRALYVGNERRVSERVAIGARTSYRTSFRRRPALLADLSRTGCRFYSGKAPDPDTEVRIQLPKELTGGESIELPGWVVRCERDAMGSEELPYCVGVAFEVLPGEIDEKLGLVLGAAAQGPERMDPREAEEAWREWSRRGAARRGFALGLSQADPRTTRRSARRRFRSRVAALTQRDRALRTLVGRNLSKGGMLLDPEPDLRVGDRLAVALFGRPGQRLDMRARVVRNAASEGLALSFDPMSTQTERQLEGLIAGLEPIAAGEGHGDEPVMVVGEIRTRERVPKS